VYSGPLRIETRIISCPPQVINSDQDGLIFFGEERESVAQEVSLRSELLMFIYLLKRGGRFGVMTSQEIHPDRLSELLKRPKANRVQNEVWL